jgi:hypothetical protein
MDGMNIGAVEHPVRCEGLDIKAVTDGYIVHQVARDRIHYLNEIAALVLELCNGSISAQNINRFLSEAFDLQEPPTVLVDSCLERIVAEELVEFRAV